MRWDAPSPTSALGPREAWGGQSDPWNHSEPRCKACGRGVDRRMSGAVKVGEEVFHASCFCCSRCRQPIEGRFFQSSDDDTPGASRGSYLCQSCQPRCAKCREGLAGRRFIKVPSGSYHEECFRCCGCDRVLEDGYFEAPHNNPFEADHGAARYHCARCHAIVLQRKEDIVEARSVAAQEFNKHSNTRKFQLAWREELAPDPNQALRDLHIVPPSVKPSNGHLVSLVLDSRTGAVGVAPLEAKNAKAAVSLPYLAVVLQVLRDTGREPRFSLDPKDSHDLGGPILVKRFEPSWLAGTVVGEVLFQADYALKQLCFGDLRLPGIPSVFDGELGGGQEAIASRQWFTMKRVGVSLSPDGAVIPHVELGVEARRLQPGPRGYEDAPQTDPNDPTVRQAAIVTARFPEIAAQVPVAGELMQLARATVLAVYLLKRGCQLNDAVLRSYRPLKVPEEARYPLEIPVLVKDRSRSLVAAKQSDLARAGSMELSVQRLSKSMRGGVDLSVPLPSKKAQVETRPVPAPLLDSRAPPVLFPLFTAARAA